MAEFLIESFQNEFLPEGATVMHAVVTVTVSGTGTGSTMSGGGLVVAPEGGRAEVIVIDTSGSMSGPRLREAKAATVAAIDCLPDGVRFGLVAGSHVAEVVYPGTPPLAVSSASTRHEAKEAVRRLEAGGGTAIGAWIDCCARILGAEPGIKHAILLTDGKNESEEAGALDAALGRAEGAFQCDCRGVGADFEVADLMKIATTLLGTQDIVADASGLTADFTAMMHEALSKQVSDVALRVWAPQGAEVVVVKQMEPMLPT